MKNKTTIKTNGREIVAVELLEGAYGFSISDWVNGYAVLDYQYEDDLLEYKILSTTKQNYKIIGLLSEFTEEQCKPYINNYFFDVKHKSNTSIEKLILILKSHDIDTTKPLLIIEKLKYNEPRQT